MQQDREGAVWKRLLHCFCPHYKTTVLNKPPSITLWLLSLTNYMIWKILQSCFEVHLLQQLSLSVFQTKSSPKSLQTQASGSGVLRDSCEKLCQEGKGGLQMIQAPAPLQPATTSLLATSQPWKRPSEIITYILWGQRDKQKGHKNTDLSCSNCQQGGTLH